MKNKVAENKNGLGWCFATINGKLGEIYFNIDKKGKSKIHSHCYVKREEFSKREQKIIESDIKKYQFTWRKGIYKTKTS